MNTSFLIFKDMAPRYMVSRKMADSEYKSSYIPDVCFLYWVYFWQYVLYDVKKKLNSI